MPIQHASQGTLSVLAIFALIFRFLERVDTTNESSDIVDRRGVVLIDELDAHLHPSWQRMMVPLLRKKFPNVQFICTGHSPMLVGGCLEGEVSLLRAQTDGRIVVDQFEEDFIGWETEDIYRRVFEVEQRDEEYERLNALQPKQTKMLKDLEKLESVKKPNDDQHEEMRKLSETLHYMDLAKKRSKDIQVGRDRELTIERLEQENKTLKLNRQLTSKDSL